MSTLEYTMDKVNFGMSLKNIPPGNKSTVKNMIIQAADRFIQKIRWRTLFYLNPQNTPQHKENYGFKSLRAPQLTPDMHAHLKPFEDGILNLVQNIQCSNKTNNFQNKLKNEVKTIENEPNLIIPAD